MKPQGGADRLRPFFLDIFSGEECVAKQLRTKNVAVKTFDIRQGVCGDVSLKSTLRRILALVNTSRARVCHATTHRAKGNVTSFV